MKAASDRGTSPPAEGSSKPPPSFRDLMGANQPHHGLRVIADSRRNDYVRRGDAGPWTRIDSPKASALVAASIYETSGVFPRNFDVQEVIEQLKMTVRLTPKTHEVSLRVAALPGGSVEIYVGDPADTRIRISAGTWSLMPGSSSGTHFHETQATAPFAIPAKDGSIRLLERYLNLSPTDRGLLLAWITYVLAHAKVAGTAFPILALGGEQGSGKTFLCHLIQSLVDPSLVGVQSFPRTERDFAVTTQLSSVVFYDNVRMIARDPSDMLCRAATGGMFTIRKLLSDGDVVTLSVHGAIVLNGIHAYIDQPDLAQRSLPLTLLTIDETRRRSERAIKEEFARDLPKILGGLLDLIAGILKHLPDVQPVYPERMIDFVRWMAAMERHLGIAGSGEPPYQRAYSEALRRGMRNSLEELPLGNAVLELAQGWDLGESSWGPTELFEALGKTAGRRAANSRDWPLNPSAMSKRLRSLQAALRQQGVELRFGRGRERRITIIRTEVAADEE